MSIISCDLMGLLVFISANWINPLRRVRQFCNFLKNFDFIIRGIKIMGCWLHNLDCHIGTILEVFSKPDCWKMTPPKFLNQNISIDQNFSNVAGMVAPNFIVFNALILAMVLVIKLSNPIPQIGGLITNFLILWLKLFRSFVIRVTIALKVDIFLCFICMMMGLPSAKYFFCTYIYIWINLNTRYKMFK